jgi:GT2 family glycosyltransferase
MIDVEIVICTYNRRDLLARTLSSLNEMSRPADCHVAILVVANACTDGTATLLESYERDAAQHSYLPLRWIEESEPGKANALNTAIRYAYGRVLAFVDDDHRVGQGYLESIHRAVHTHPEWTMVCGRIWPDWDGREPAWAHDFGPYTIYPLPVPRYDQGTDEQEIAGDRGLPGGGNLAIRQEVFVRIGGFSTELGPEGHNLGGGEDSDFISRALRAGERLGYVPDMLQYHYVDGERFRLHYLLRKSYQRSHSLTRVRQTHASFPPRFLWRKLMQYVLNAATALYWPEVRFFLVRIAATLGEIRGYLPTTRRASSSD